MVLQTIYNNCIWKLCGNFWCPGVIYACVYSYWNYYKFNRTRRIIFHFHASSRRERLASAFSIWKPKRLLQIEKSANCSQQFHAFFWATSFPGFPFSSLPSSRTRLRFGFLVTAERHSGRGAPYLKEIGQETYLSQKMCLWCQRTKIRPYRLFE